MTRNETVEKLVARPGHLGIVTLLEDATFAAWTPVGAIPTHLSSMEGMLARGGGGLPRTREEQASLRVHLCSLLRDRERAEALYSSWIASATLWLAWNHWREEHAVRLGVEALVAREGRAVLTTSIATPAPAGAHPDTAWAFMVGTRVHDGRAQLADAPPGELRVTRAPGLGADENQGGNA